MFLMYVSVGDLAHYSTEHPTVAGEVRAREIAAAAAEMGVDDYSILYKDADLHMRIDSLPRRDLIAQIERESVLSIEKTKPDILLMPAISFNQDHEAIFYAAYAACRPHLNSDKHFINTVLAYDQPQLAWNHTPFHPNFYVDISDFLDLKLRAHACHKSQLRPEPHHGSLENLERLARLRGSEIAVMAAEAYHCHRCIL